MPKSKPMPKPKPTPPPPPPHGGERLVVMVCDDHFISGNNLRYPETIEQAKRSRVRPGHPPVALYIATFPDDLIYLACK